jgi:hypothetical protein
MAYEIDPYVSAGALRFGMTPGEVHQVLGTARFSRRDQGRLREMHGIGGPALTFTGTDNELRLVEIGFAKAAGEVSYGGINLFAGERRAIVRQLCALDPAPKDVAGTIVLTKLGISLTGFDTGPEESLAVTAFAPGRWDEQIARAASFDMGQSRT